MKNSTNNTALGFVCVFSFALIIRIIYIYHQMENPFSLAPISDSATYILEAEGILKSGNWLGKQVFSSGGAAFYDYFLAIIFTLFGKNYLIVRIIQHLMGAMSCGTIYLIGRRLYGHSIGLIIGLWSSIFSPFLFHEGLLLTSASTILFLSLSIYYLMLSVESLNPRTALLVGVLLGLSALCRPNVLLLTPVYFFGIICKDPKSIIKSATPYLMILGIFIVIFPVTLRNYKVGKDWVLISSGGGFNFFLGNNDEATGVFHIPPKSGVMNDYTMYQSSHMVAERNLGMKLKPSKASQYWLLIGLNFIKKSPAKAASLFWRKFNFFWNNKEITNMYQYEFFRKYSFLLHGVPQSFGVAALFGLIGAFWILYEGSREEMILPGLLFTYMLSVIIFVVSSRLREPIAIFLFLSAGYTFRKLKDFKQLRAWIKILLPGLFLSLFIYQKLPDNIRPITESYSYSYFQLGKKFIKLKNYNQAMNFLSAALETDPNNIRIMVEVAKAAEKMGKITKALELYKKVLTYKNFLPSKPKSTGRFSWPEPNQMLVYRADNQLGKIYFNKADYPKAEKHLKDAIARYPFGLEAHMYLAFSYEKQGKLNKAIAEYQEYLAIYPRDQNIRQHVNQLLLDTSP